MKNVIQQFICFIALVGLSAQLDAFVNEPDQNGQRHIVVITASYNNKDWYKHNLDSVFGQNYQNWNLIYVDDCSSDGTAYLVENYVTQTKQNNKVKLIKNNAHRGAMYNQYHAISSCNDKDIIVILDGDDFLADRNVFAYLNQIYSDNNIWLTYGQFKEYPTNYHGFCMDMPADIVKNNAFRDWGHIPSHLRSFYAGLFKQIKKEDLMYNGEFLEMDADIAAMFPMIEMARDHFKFISKVLYIYNGENVLNDHKRSKALQRELDLYLRSKKRYDKSKSPVILEN